MTHFSFILFLPLTDPLTGCDAHDSRKLIGKMRLIRKAGFHCCPGQRQAIFQQTPGVLHPQRGECLMDTQSGMGGQDPLGTGSTVSAECRQIRQVYAL